MAFEVWGLVSLLIFYLIIFLVGIYASWKLKKNHAENSTEDAILAGRDLGLVVGMFSMTATWVNGGYMNGASEVVYKRGILWCQGSLGYSISLIIAGKFFAKKMRDQGYVTMLDPFHLKYGKWMAAFMYIPSMLGDVLTNGAILAALGDTVAVVIDLQVEVSIIISGVIAIIYTLAGGMYSVTYTDVAELICIFVGIWLCVPYCMLSKYVGSISESRTHYWGTILPKEAGQYTDGFLLLILGGIPCQTYFQRVLASRTSRIAEKVSYIAGIWCIVLAIPPVIIGTVARAVDWNSTAFGHVPVEAREVSMILPIALLQLTPKAVAYIGLGTIAAAVMSSSDAAILSSSSQFIRIVYKNLCRPQASDREMLWVMRAAMIVFGILATVLSITVKTVYGLWYLSGDLVYVTLFPQLTCLLYLERHCNVWGAATALIVCSFLRLICGEPSLNLPPLVKLPLYDEAEDIQMFPYKTIIMLIGFVLILGVSKLTSFIDSRGLWKTSTQVFICSTELTEKNSNGKHEGIRELPENDFQGRFNEAYM